MYPNMEASFDRHCWPCRSGYLSSTEVRISLKSYFKVCRAVKYMNVTSNEVDGLLSFPTLWRPNFC